MELITKRVHTMRTKCEAVSQVTFDEDLNVPDVKPDVGRMIQKKGEIQIDEMQVSDGHVFFNGALLVALLYVSAVVNLQEKIGYVSRMAKNCALTAIRPMTGFMFKSGTASGPPS